MRSSTLAVALLLAAASTAGAQQAPRCPATISAAADTLARRPDVVIRASASAERVTFGGEPRVEVRLTGCSVLDSVRVLERRNLPKPVQPGVTYRDVYVAVEILGHLDVECLLPGLSLARPCAPAPADSAAAPPR